MKRLVAALFALVTLASLSACGQKGPLYLPEADQPAADQHQH